jgi:hypothetical protein
MYDIVLSLKVSTQSSTRTLCLAVHTHQSVVLSVSSSCIWLIDGGVTSGLVCEYFIAMLCWLIGSDVGVSYTVHVSSEHSLRRPNPNSEGLLKSCIAMASLIVPLSLHRIPPGPTLNVVNFVGRNPTGLTVFSNVVLCCVVYIGISASASSVLTSPMNQFKPPCLRTWMRLSLFRHL